MDQASELLHRLAALGIGIAIDDFGTGWASLTYLKQFPIHALKIDRVFVDGVATNTHDTAIARSILSLGAELGLFVIAEGIETVAQQERCRPSVARSAKASSSADLARPAPYRSTERTA